MIAAFLLFVGVDLIGEWIRQRLGVPFPGPLIGLVLLTACLYFRPQFATGNIRAAARVLLVGMSMFFVPAGTGVITRMQQIRLQWVPITVALCISTVASLLVTAWLMRGLDALLGRWFSEPSAPSSLG